MKAVVMHEFLAGLGVDEQIDYTEHAFEDEVDGAGRARGKHVLTN